jgi:hypothetical protein
MVDISSCCLSVDVDTRELITECLDDDVSTTCDYILQDSRAEAYIRESLEDDTEQSIKVTRNKVSALQKELDSTNSMVNLLLRGQERMFVKLDKLTNERKEYNAKGIL